MSSTFENLSPPCPFCAQAVGRVFAVKFGGNVKTLTFRCEACQCRWAADECIPAELDGLAIDPSRLLLTLMRDGR